VHKQYPSPLVLDIFPELDNLSPFVHPRTRLSYRWLNSSQIIELAEKSLNQLVQLDIDQVIVAESGAMPFAKVCQWLSKKKGLNLHWYSIKVPRDIHDFLEPTIQYGLKQTVNEWKISENFDQTPVGFGARAEINPGMMGEVCLPPLSSELNALLESKYFETPSLSLMEALRTAPKNPSHERLSSLTRESDLSKILAKPFIYFDEYIDSGKTLFQTIRFLNLFAEKLDFKLFSYMTKLPKSQVSDYSTSLFTAETEFDAYKIGVYPFENRVDWIGYFYFTQPGLYKRISVSELALEIASIGGNCDSSLLKNQSGKYIEIVNWPDLTSTVKSNCTIPVVADYISQHHVQQYGFFLLEKISRGSTPTSEFFFQLFDMYGPVWSPMPDDYHFNYWETFEKSRPQLESALSNPTVQELYERIRRALVCEVAALCESRRADLNHSLTLELEKKYMNVNFEKFVDISMELNAKTLVWVEDKSPELIPVARQPQAPVNFTWLSFGAHAGTHVDAPYYLYNEKWTSDQIPLSRMMGKCQVLDLTHVDRVIEVEDLKKLDIRQKKIFLKTKNSYDPLVEFHHKHVVLSVPAAEYLVNLGMETVGYDYQTFEQGGSNDVHRAFLKESVTLLDNLRLADAEAKEYFLMCLPVKVTGIDAAPARAVLFEMM